MMPSKEHRYKFCNYKNVIIFYAFLSDQVYINKPDEGSK